MVNLVVGATGLVGTEICRILIERGRSVRALVRTTSSPEKVARLKNLGASVVTGDLKDRASLDEACRGASVVLSTASSTLSRQIGDSIETVDHRGQLDLIEAAAAADVERFVFLSFSSMGLEFPLQSAKRTAEQRLRHSGMTYTILRPPAFMEVWLSPALGFDVAGGRARIYGTGERKISWISSQDVARFASLAVDAQAAENAIVNLGGPEALSPLEVVRLAEEVLGKRFGVEHVPEDALRSQYAAAIDPLEKSFAALMLCCAAGDVIDVTETLRVLPLQRLKSVREYLQAAASTVG